MREAGDVDGLGKNHSKFNEEPYLNGNIPWLKTKEVNQCRIYSTENHITQLGLDNSSAKLIPVNSVTVAMYGDGQTAGRVGLTKIPLATNQACCNLILNEEIADAEFVFYHLLGSYEELVARKTGSGQQNLNTQLIKAFEIPLPSLSEQKAIAAVLSSIDEKIDLLQRENKTLATMAETLFRQWFIEEAVEDWTKVRLSEICASITKGTTPTTLGHQFVEAGVNFVKAESITDGGEFIVEKFAKISTETHQLLKRSVLESGDVLCSIAGTIGRVAIADDFILPANTNQAIAILRVNRDKCSPEFIYLFLNSAIFREKMDGKIVHAVQPNLSLGEIGNTVLQLPSSDMLHQFEKVIRPIFEKKRGNTRQLRTLENLRDTLLPKLMSGEVRVAPSEACNEGALHG